MGIVSRNFRALSSEKYSMRIYEIAKKLKVSSKDVIAFLKGLGVDCPSHMSVLSDDVAQKVSQHFTKPSGKEKSEYKSVDGGGTVAVKIERKAV